MFSDRRVAVCLVLSYTKSTDWLRDVYVYDTFDAQDARYLLRFADDAPSSFVVAIRLPFSNVPGISFDAWFLNCNYFYVFVRTNVFPDMKKTFCIFGWNSFFFTHDVGRQDKKKQQQSLHKTSTTRNISSLFHDTPMTINIFSTLMS